MTRELICTAIKIAIAINDVTSNHGIIRRKTDASFFDKMIEPFIRNPTQCVAHIFGYDGLQRETTLTTVLFKILRILVDTL